MNRGWGCVPKQGDWCHEWGSVEYKLPAYASVIIMSCHVMEQSRGEVILRDITFLRQNSWMGFVHCILWWQSGNLSHIITLPLWLRLEDKHKNWAEGARGLTKVQADQGQHSPGIWNEHTKYESHGKTFPRESHTPWRVVWTFRDWLGVANHVQLRHSWCH